MLTDGTEYDVDWCNADRGVFHINLITSAPFPELASKFYDSNLTKNIAVENGDGTRTIYEGYTALQSIVLDNWGSGTVMITLVVPGREY